MIMVDWWWCDYGGLVVVWLWWIGGGVIMVDWWWCDYGGLVVV